MHFESFEYYTQHAWYYLSHLFSGKMTEWDPLEWFLVSMVLFVTLASIFPGKPTQKRFHRGNVTDSIYWFLSPLVLSPYIYGPVYGYCIAFFSSFKALHYMQQHVKLDELPILLQAFLVLLIGDFLQYWIHRGFHKSPNLWKFHAIHHSATDVDWTTSARFHPINILLYSTFVNAIVAVLGFKFEAFLLLIPFNAIYSPLVHANLNWTYGPFKYLLASPVFHRWHHTYPDKGGDKNFAPTFPFLDKMFGTFYMPKDDRPTEFGAPYDNITNGFLNQIIYPFKEDKPKQDTATTIVPAEKQPDTVTPA